MQAATEIQLQFGMGIKVTSNDRSNSPMGGPGSATGSLGMLLQRESEFGGEALESSPEQASRFARSLGFIEEGEWSLSAQHQPQSSAGTTNPGPAGANFEHIPGVRIGSLIYIQSFNYASASGQISSLLSVMYIKWALLHSNFRL